MKWTQAQRAEKMNPSVLREILRATQKYGGSSFAGGTPPPKTPLQDGFAVAYATFLKRDGEGVQPGWLQVHRQV